MAEIKIANADRVAVVDNIDAPSVLEYEWRQISLNGQEWIGTSGRGRSVCLANYVMQVSSSTICRYRNGDIFDNRKSNIEVIAPEQHVGGPDYKRNRLGFRGIRVALGGKFQAQIRAAGRLLYSRVCATPDEAAREYDKMAVALHGPTAVTNFKQP